MTTALTVNLDDQKRAFAAAWLRKPDKPFEAASSVISDTGLALQAATTWVNDHFVKQCQIELIEQFGVEKFIPNDVDQLNDIWTIASNTKVDNEVRLKAHELYAKIRQGYFHKPLAIGSQTNILNQGVMVVNNHGTDEEWEQSCIAQQQELIANGR